MFRHLRPHLRVLAGLVLVAVSSLGVWSAVAHGLDCHDAEDAPVLVAHDASAHAFRGAPLPAGGREIHCVLCHWTRTFGPCVDSVAATPAAVDRPLVSPSAFALVARLTAASQPPLRAPPSGAVLDSTA